MPLKPKVCLSLFGFVVVFLLACNHAPQSKPSTQKGKYSLYIRIKNGAEFVVPVDNLSSGNVDPEEDGVALDVQEVGRDLIVKDGYYYCLGFKSEQFIKYRVKHGAFEKVDSVSLAGFSIENYKWVGKDRLQLIGLRAPAFKEVVYDLLATDTLRLLASHKLPIPLPANGFTTTSVGFAEPFGRDLLLGYSYHKPKGVTSYTTSDTMYASVVNVAKASLIKTDRDLRSTYPAGLNTVQSYSFYAETGDFYFMTCPGIALGNRPDEPTGVFRIKKGQSIIDKNYFFNLSASTIQNHAYGLWYLGNGKAIVRSERKDLYHDLNDHYSVAHFEFYILNLAEQSVKKLNLPLDKGTRRECVIVEGDKAYISINSDKEGNYIWVYDIKNGELTKGLHLTGKTDYILRIDKLNPS